MIGVGMASQHIFNSLLRVSHITGEPPAPFEKPNATMNFWVLELPAPSEGAVGEWFAQVTAVLASHALVLAESQSQGAQLTLFIASSTSRLVFRLEVAFLKVLADMGIALEYFNADLATEP